ncbi:MAG TPA: aminotransferase class V-fold PLP-dependent enzyme, partial [Spirochaetota bacterium]|nr:aminotransferase class V-fold PLP-dependent enzyme [Spirochaetota bacterium]
MDKLPYDLNALPRETKKYYISADTKDIQAMLKALQLKNEKELFSHVPDTVLMKENLDLPEPAAYNNLIKELKELAGLNRQLVPFIGDGLQWYKVPDITRYVAGIRGLSTSYTPYQPERSQGTLMSQWLYQCGLAALTGMEAINASMYDRSTALWEALNCSLRLKRSRNTVIVYNTIFPGDMEVLKTLSAETGLKIVKADADLQTGTVTSANLDKALAAAGDDLAAVAFPQVNHFGLLEDPDAAVDAAHRAGAKAVAVIDPVLLADQGLKPPLKYGSRGADMIVGEGQHLATAPNWGGPGLGIFGIRYNQERRKDIRASAGRYVGAAVDNHNNPCKVMILSTREQHIKREKATSNICSNEAFIATLAGAALLQQGDEGLAKACAAGRQNACRAYSFLTGLKGIEPAFPQTPFFNEFTLRLTDNPAELIKAGIAKGLLLGVDVSDRFPDNRNYIMLSFSDMQEEKDMTALFSFFKERFAQDDRHSDPVPVPENYLRSAKPGLPRFSLDELKTFYKKLGNQNISPDSSCYPLGSCTMKYNPYINDYTAALPGFQNIHPQAPAATVQGSLAVLYHIQEYFKKITGLPRVCTQPVAGAAGELLGLKLIQAYHRENSQSKRDIILIPDSAHGTNPASAVMAGFNTKGKGASQTGVVFIKADEKGCISLADLDEKINRFSERISAVMITNPNTSGIYETAFRQIADKIHAAGGLVYMDGANMNAIAGWIDLNKLGVDAVHNNLHKTWSISHGGGGPGDAIVAVSAKLAPYISGQEVQKKNGTYFLTKTEKSIGSVHRHLGNFQHKIRCYTYLRRLGTEGIRRMASFAVLSARYVCSRLINDYKLLPAATGRSPRMHEFIITLKDELFKKITAAGIPANAVIGSFAKLFLDFGFHPPTVSFPEVFGLMI